MHVFSKNNQAVVCKLCSIGIKGPNVRQEDTTFLNPFHHYQQPDLLMQGRLGPWIHVDSKVWPFYLHFTAELGIHQTRWCFSYIQLPSFRWACAQWTLNFFSCLTGEEPLSFNVLSVLRSISVQYGCKMVFLSVRTCLAILLWPLS